MPFVPEGYVLSPDDRWLTMPLKDAGTTNIWAFPTDGGPARQFTDFGPRPILIARQVSWSPDGQFVMEARRDEGRSERVHLRQRRHVTGVAEVVRVSAARQARACCGLDGDHANRSPAAELLPDERERDAGEVRPAAGATDHDVRIIVGHFHLRDGFLTDDRLVKQYVIQHRSEGVLRVVAAGRDLHRL